MNISIVEKGKGKKNNSQRINLFYKFYKTYISERLESTADRYRPGCHLIRKTSIYSIGITFPKFQHAIL